MTRDEALAAIFEERHLQDLSWRNRGVMDGQYDYAAPHILLLEECTDKLRKAWYGVSDEGNLRDRLVKIAAVSLRALEEIKYTK
jgi:hypothetical protein